MRLQRPDRPEFVKYENLHDSSGWLTITEEPAWVTDPLNSDRKMLKIVGNDDRGKRFQLNARTQMPDCIVDAGFAAGIDEIVAGGRLKVTFVDWRKTMKVYAAEYIHR